MRSERKCEGAGEAVVAAEAERVKTRLNDLEDFFAYIGHVLFEDVDD